jgi:UDP-N-acetylmuramate dehydrogenase
VIEEFDAPLAPLTTMRVGGPAARLVTVTSTDELVDAIREVDDAGEPLLVVSGGSNVVIADAGFAGTVVRVASRGIQVESVDRCSGAFVRVAAGEPWDELVAHAVAEGWSGVEALSGIPGATGSTPIQNVGAYGQEVAETIAQVRVWDRNRQAVRTLMPADCSFGYRDSLLKRAGGRLVVLDVAFQLPLGGQSAPVRYADLAAGLGVALGDRVALTDARAAVLAQRRRRGMVLDPDDHDTWSCGSFFTNPVVEASVADRVAALAAGGPGASMPRWPTDGGLVKLSAAWLIEQAGYGKGHGLPGPASLSTKHTLAVTNRGAATAADVVALARAVRDGVSARFGVCLVNEPVLVGVRL